MKILFCNKYNFKFSGTEVYLFELMDLLRSHGHEVALFSMEDSRGEPTPYDQFFVPHVDFKDSDAGPLARTGSRPTLFIQPKRGAACAPWSPLFSPTSPMCATSTTSCRRLFCGS